MEILTYDGKNVMFVVKDGVRELRFDGELLAQSSSRKKGKFRWIEFELYRTSSGKYVISRVGVSLYYHLKTCPTVHRSGIKPVPSEVLSINLVPCQECLPDRKTDNELYPETSRHYAQAFNYAEDVVDSLRKEDDKGLEYITDVAKRLLISASLKDEEIKNSFYVEWID